MTMITPSYLGETIEYSSLHACRSTLEDPTVSSLTRGFKASLGVSPHNWLLNRRIALAQRLIYDGDTPLSEVAASCGFSDQSHLTRVFIRKVGSSPGAWRRYTQR